MKYKIIVCDLDNTLVDSKKRLSKETIDYMIELQEKGYLVILASGRYIKEIEPVKQALQIEEHKGIVIACNGFEVYDYREHSYHSFTKINQKEANALIALAKEKECGTYLYKGENYYFIPTKTFHRLMKIGEKTFPLAAHLHPKISHGIMRYKEMKILKELTFDCDFQKLCFLSYKPANIVELQKEVKKCYGDTYHFFYENKFITEISKSDVSKMHAVQYVLDKYGYTMEDVIAFGDNGNDSLLLEAAGRGVTMKNASKYIKQKASYITDKTCDENGVIEYLKTLHM